MDLQNIPFDKLSISDLNMRQGKRAPDIADILPSVRAKGVLVPLIVRPKADDPAAFEIIAGRRRWYCVKTLIEHGVEPDPIPCAIMAAGDDAAALEASLIENTARLDPDEVACWETFTRLIETEGRAPEDVAQTFGVTDLYLRRVMALGNLHPRLRALYRNEDIDRETIRHLTLASRSQQKAWLKMFDDETMEPPTRRELKAWLFGGGAISSAVALFPLDDYPGTIVTDLFGDGGYFADSDAFWTRQNAAIADKAEALRAAGWQSVEVLDIGERFYAWDYEKTPMERGGAVYITVSDHGEVEVHEGWLDRKTAAKARAELDKSHIGEDDRALIAASKPEVSGPMQTYIDLHRHAAVRAELLAHPAVALRLMLAHAIAGSSLWKVEVEDQAARHIGTSESLAACPAEAIFSHATGDTLTRLGLPPDLAHVAGADEPLDAIFGRLLALPDDDVMAVLCVVMGETLAAGTTIVEAVGHVICVDMAKLWRVDTAFFDLLRDRQVINAVLRDVAGKRIADGNVAETLKTQKGIIRDFLTGQNNRPKVENWLPKWLAFPPASYTQRPFATRARWRAIAANVLMAARENARTEAPQTPRHPQDDVQAATGGAPATLPSLAAE